jgi:GAF domain-containing protein
MSDHDRLVQALTRFAQTMSDRYELSDVLYRLSDEVTAVLGIAGAGIALIDQADGHLRYAAATDDDVARLERIQEEHQAGPCVEAHRSQAPVLVEDVAARPDWPAYRKAALAVGLRSVAGLPIRIGVDRFGALDLYDTGPGSWSEDDLGAARVLCDMAAGYLVHAALADVRATAEQLQQALESRVLIEQAKGILSGELGTSVDDAFERLRRHSRTNNTSIRVVAKAVVEDGFRPG